MNNDCDRDLLQVATSYPELYVGDVDLRPLRGEYRCGVGSTD